MSHTRNMRAVRPALALVVAYIVFFAFQNSAWAAGAFQTKAEYAILMDADTGSVLFQKRADDLMAPASMSKLMTLAVIFDRLKTDRLKMDEKFFVSENAWRTGGAPSGTSAMFAPLNSEIAVSELLKGIIIQSGNDACIIIAEGISGSEEAFAAEMTKYARKIGLKKSEFRNSTGLPDPDHLMTARELAELSIHIIREFPEYYPIFKEKEYRYRKHKFFNRNPLIYLSLGVDGLKTGYTKESGYGIVASNRRGKQRLVVVVNGLKSKKERGVEARKLLEWGARNFKQYTLFNEDQQVGNALVWGGSQHYVKLVGKGAVRILLPRFGDKKIKASVVYDGPLKPPVNKGDQIARLRVTAANGATYWLPLYAGEDIAEGTFLIKGVDSLLFAAFGWIL